MRNLKKILALALVFAMAFTFTAGAADFTDKAEIGADYVDDVNMLVELGVIAGYPDGSFGPQKNITRAEFAKMAYTLKYGSDKDGELFAAQKSAFTDVEGDSNVAWAKGYINYCANQKIVSGVGNNKFNPQGNITVAEATKMILVIMGCDPAKEGFTGANWAANVTSKAIDLGVFDGWTGDPTSLATRELVAKLMRNAIFAPVYTYSAITGTGSQLTALGAKNETLGEQTMGLKSVTGIVVANENYFIDKNEEGEDIDALVSTVADEDESTIYYEKKDSDGDIIKRVLTIDRALADDMLGAKVNVFFQADVASSAEYDYKNVEVIGDVLLNSDTVVYEVPSIDVDLYPNGGTESATKITPYIGFTVDGVEKQIKASSDLGRVEKQYDIQKDTTELTDRQWDSDDSGKIDDTDDFHTVADVLAAFGSYAWVSDETTAGGAATLENAPVGGFFEDMGKATLSDYRFVSVDGGKSYSYIFKMVADDRTNAGVGYITNYSEAKGTITLSAEGRFDLEEVNIIGDVATDDLVIYFRENQLLNIVKAEAVTGAVEDLNDDGSVVINGENYYLWQFAYDGTDLDISDDDTLASYLARNSGAMGTSTTYYTYNNVVVDLSVSEESSVASDYAVILGSYYDYKLNAAYVTLAFADNTSASYQVGKLRVEKSSEPNNKLNDRASDFENNKYFGMLVKYKIMDNGSVDLSGTDLGYTYDNSNAQAGKEYDDTNVYMTTKVASSFNDAKADEGVLTYGETELAAINDSSIIYVIYGSPKHYERGGEYVSDFTDPDYKAVKAVAYKFNNKKAQDIGAVGDFAVADGAGDVDVEDVKTLSYVVNTEKTLNQGIVVAAMTVDSDSGYANEGKSLAYIASATKKYDVAAGGYYAQFTLIDENGLVSKKTIADVKDINNNTIDFTVEDSKTVGKIDGDYEAGTFVTYDVDADGNITVLDKQFDVPTPTASKTDGIYLVNVFSTRNDTLFYLDANADYDKAALATATTSSIKFHEDGYEVIAIDDEEYIGESIVKVSTREDKLEANKGNAVIQVFEGEVIRVFSFTDGYKLY